MIIGIKKSIFDHANFFRFIRFRADFVAYATDNFEFSSGVITTKIPGRSRIKIQFFFF